MSDSVKMENHYCPLQIYESYYCYYERPRLTKAETSKNHELKMEHISWAGQKPRKSSRALKGNTAIGFSTRYFNLNVI